MTKENVPYMSDFEKACKGEKFMKEVDETLPRYVRYLNNDQLCEMLALLFDPDNIARRRSLRGYLPDLDIRVYNRIQLELLTRVPMTEDLEKLTKQYNVKPFISINPRKYFKKVGLN